MRILMWLFLGFAAACGGCAYLLPAQGLLPLGILLAFLAAGAGILCRTWRDPILRALALAILGCALGLLRWSAFDTMYLAPLRPLNGQSVTADIRISSYSQSSDYGITADGTVQLRGRSYKLRLYLSEEDALEPGDVVRGSFRLRITTAVGEQAATHHSGSGIWLLAYQRGDVSVCPGSQERWYDFAAHWRRSALDFLDLLFPEDTAWFARALLLGDTGGIPYSVDTHLKLSGIRHIVAVSGLHISILCAAVVTLVGRRKALTPVLGLACLLLFAAVAGFSPSVVRACIMSAMMLLSLPFARQYDPPTALAVAAGVLLAANPVAITAPSFQLSFGCMLGIFLLGEPVKAWLEAPSRLGRLANLLGHKRVRDLASSMGVSLGAAGFTTPLSAAYFGTVSLVNPLTNLLTLWAVNLIFYGILFALGIGAVFLPAGKAVAWLVSWLMRLVLQISRVLASFPLSVVYTKSRYIVAWLVLVYVLMAVFLLGRRRKPALFSALAALLLSAAVLASWLQPRRYEVQLTALDVGNGQCVIFQSGGRTFVVDCGGTNDREAAEEAAQTLLSQGISRIDGLILTHFDADHTGGVPYLLSRVHADRVLMPAGEASVYHSLDNAYGVEETTQLGYGNVRISLFPGKPGSTGNESSVCVLFQTENCDILITGDRDIRQEAYLLTQAQLPRLEVLVAGHHGAAGATGQALLAATLPETVIISVDADNRYGHPAQEVLQRLAEFNCRVLRTDLLGTIIYRR